MTDKVLITGIRASNTDNKDTRHMLVTRTFSEPEKAWLAAAIDGEGSIGLYMLKRQGYRILQIQLANTNKEFAEQVRQIIGGGSSIQRTMFRPMGHEGRKPIYHYVIKGQRCISVLEQILPYLIIKREKAIGILKELKEHPLQGYGGWWAQATPEAKAKIAEKQHVAWQNPDIRKRRTEGIRNYWARKRAEGGGGKP